MKKIFKVVLRLNFSKKIILLLRRAKLIMMTQKRKHNKKIMKKKLKMIFLYLKKRIAHLPRTLKHNKIK